MTGRTAIVVAMCALGYAGALAAPQQHAYGLFAVTPDGEIELKAWAEAAITGQLRMGSGKLEDAPLLPNVLRILCHLPNWQPAAVYIASAQLFRDERAERRAMPFAVRVINMAAIDIRVRDLEEPETMARLVRAVRASDKVPPYVFIRMFSSGLERHYVFRVKLDAAK